MNAGPCCLSAPADGARLDWPAARKPRTVTGWAGLISDPFLDGSQDMLAGLRIARGLLLDVAATGLPTGCEWLYPASAPYLTDLVAYGTVGARTVESQVHRQLASGLPMPIGFKNGTDGDVRTAVNACVAASARHRYLGMSPEGKCAIVTTEGNRDCHVVLRGGARGPNYGREQVSAVLGLLGEAGLPRRLIVDASHGNSGKDHRRQPIVAADVAGQVAAGERGISGVMLESFLVEGRKDLGDPALVYGQSVTDACMDFTTTTRVCADLAAAVRARRVTGEQP
jgi:3-deoxy-7-phosphoheptulonate synthase